MVLPSKNGWSVQHGLRFSKYPEAGISIFICIYVHIKFDQEGSRNERTNK